MLNCFLGVSPCITDNPSVSESCSHKTHSLAPVIITIIIITIIIIIIPTSYFLTPWSRVLLEKLIGFQAVKKFPHIMEPEGSLPHSQVPATCPYPDPAQSSPYTHIPPPGDPS